MMPVFFVDAGDERLIKSSATSRADGLKILFIKFLICSYKKFFSIIFLRIFQKIINFFKYFLLKIHK